MNKTNKILIALFVIFAVLFTGCSEKNTTDVKTTTNTSAIMQKEDGAKSDAQVSQEKLAQVIADGTYSEPIDYSTPAGLDQIKLNFEVKEGKVISFNVENVKVAEVSSNFNKNFDSEIQTLTVGKSISEIKIPVIVAGASLTTKAVNEKLAALKSN